MGTLENIPVTEFIEDNKYKVYTRNNYRKMKYARYLSKEELTDIDIISQVLPFRVNNYVLDNLINWNDYTNDPIYKLTFPQKGMLTNNQYQRVINANKGLLPVDETIRGIRNELNPHPGSQLSHNIPMFEGDKLLGVQHKYPETLLFFPSAGQTCHSYCSFCFRWPQFVGQSKLKIEAKDSYQLVKYLKSHPEVTDVLITGGDPLVMSAKKLRTYIQPLLSASLPSLKTIRIGTKALTFWPYRFLSDHDSEDLLQLFRNIVATGKHLSIMAHYNHWRELDTEASDKAINAIRQTGCEIRSQGPVLSNINDNSYAWVKLWKKQVKMGIIPYYLFIERHTGASNYFEMPIVKAFNIYQKAIRSISGLGRTARGPVMSAHYGKVEVLGVIIMGGQKVFSLRYIQHRDPLYSYNIFFAKYSETASWFSELEPATKDDCPYF